MTIVLCVARPWQWRPSWAHGRSFVGWRFCWGLVAVAYFPERDDEMLKRAGLREWREA